MIPHKIPKYFGTQVTFLPVTAHTTPRLKFKPNLNFKCKVLKIKL